MSVFAIGSWRAKITPTTYLIEKIAIIKISGSQLPGTKNDWVSVEYVTLCGTAKAVPNHMETQTPIPHDMRPTGAMLNAKTTPKNESKIMAAGRMAILRPETLLLLLWE